jgi:hypothetical protein
MTMRQERFLLIACLLGAGGCAFVDASVSSVKEERPAVQSLTTDSIATAATICQIRAEPAKYFGRKVVLSATYLTDSAFYAYLIDKKCDGKQILDLGSNEPSANQSVEGFDKVVETECAVECAFESAVLVEGTVFENSKGRPSLHTSNVIRYEKQKKAEESRGHAQTSGAKKKPAH